MLWDVFVFDRPTGSMVRASADDSGEWMESSRTPSIDASGRVIIFASRHPIDDGDVKNDDDLYVWIRGRAIVAAGFTRGKSADTVRLRAR